jgi:hypothetical protein
VANGSPGCVLPTCAWCVHVTVLAGWFAGVGAPLADVNLEFLGRRCRPNTVPAAAYDLKVFFSVVGKPPHSRPCRRVWLRSGWQIRPGGQ